MTILISFIHFSTSSPLMASDTRLILILMRFVRSLEDLLFLVDKGLILINTNQYFDLVSVQTSFGDLVSAHLRRRHWTDKSSLLRLSLVTVEMVNKMEEFISFCSVEILRCFNGAKVFEQLILDFL